MENVFLTPIMVWENFWDVLFSRGNVDLPPSLIKDYLSDRKQRVVFEVQSSEWRHIGIGSGTAIVFCIQ